MKMGSRRSLGFADSLAEAIKENGETVELDKVLQPRHLLGTEGDVKDLSIAQLHRVGLEELDKVLRRVALCRLRGVDERRVGANHGPLLRGIRA